MYTKYLNIIFNALENQLIQKYIIYYYFYYNQSSVFLDTPLHDVPVCKYPKKYTILYVYIF